MGEMADLDAELYYNGLMDDMLSDYVVSETLRNKTRRYEVTDEEITEFIFETSTKSLCILADKVLMDYCPDGAVSDAEMNKIIDIAAYGLTKKYLTNKQKWCLASFCIFYIREGARTALEDSSFFTAKDGEQI